MNLGTLPFQNTKLKYGRPARQFMAQCHSWTPGDLIGLTRCDVWVTRPPRVDGVALRGEGRPDDGFRNPRCVTISSG